MISDQPVCPFFLDAINQPTQLRAVATGRDVLTSSIHGGAAAERRHENHGIQARTRRSRTTIKESR